MSLSFGRILKYFIFFLLILSFVTTIEYAFVFFKGKEAFLNSIENNFDYIVKNCLPKDLKIEGGKAQTSEIQPFSRDCKGFTLIIDTRGETKEIAGEREGMLITDKDVMLKWADKKGEYKIIKYSLTKLGSLEFKKRDLDKEQYPLLYFHGQKLIISPFTLREESEKLVKLFAPLSFTLVFIILFINEVFYLLLLSPFIFLINILFKTGFRYKNILKFGLIASIIPLLAQMLFTLLALTGFKLLFSGYLIIVLWVFVWTAALYFSKKKSAVSI